MPPAGDAAPTSDTALAVDATLPGDAARVCAVAATTACSQDVLITCDANGQQVSADACVLGCDASGASARCRLVDPSNGLATALDNAARAPDLILMGDTTIDTDAGTVTDQRGALTPPTFTLSAGLPVSVFVIEARTFTAHTVTVIGSRALAIVSSGAVQLGGALSVDATGIGVNGAGAVPSDATCRGSNAVGPNNPHGEAGGGGGGFGTRGGNGGNGGSPTLTGGGGGQTAGTLELTPLRGGCPGGRASGQFSGYSSGGGGGAIQIVSNTSISIDDGGFVSANGGGASGPSIPRFCSIGDPCGDGEGGGSGGGILLEAPSISVAAHGGITANGGGGTCAAFGSASGGLRVATAAPGQQCSGDTGSGGAGAAAMPGSLDGTSGSGSNPVGGGGGGGAGRIRINVALGTTFTPQGVVSPAASVGVLGTR